MKFLILVQEPRLTDKVDRYVKKKKKILCLSCFMAKKTINATGGSTACCRDAGKRLTLQLTEKNDLKSIWDGKVLKDSRALHEKNKHIKLMLATV